MNIMVFDLGGTSVKHGKYDGESITSKGYFKTPDSLESLLEKMANIIEQHDKIEGVAISSPGSVNQQERMIEGISAIPYIHFIPIYDLLEEKFGLPVTIENDANCAGLCEVEIGAAKEGTNIVSVVLGTGMGGSIFINRELHVGSHLFGGEFGMTLNTNGGTGSENGTLIAASKRYAKETGKYIDGVKLLELYDVGEESAIKIVNDMYDYIAEVLYNIQVIIDPDYIVLGGGISNRHSLPKEILERLNKLFEKIGIATAKPKVVNAKYKNDANLVGAVINYKKDQLK